MIRSRFNKGVFSQNSITVSMSVVLPAALDIAPRFGSLLPLIVLSDDGAWNLLNLYRDYNPTGLYETCFEEIYVDATVHLFWDVKISDRLPEPDSRPIQPPGIPAWRAFLRHFAVSPCFFKLKDEFEPSETPFGL